MTETYRVNRDEYLRVSNELNVTATAKHWTAQAGATINTSTNAQK
jgi:hypothetical protein